MGRGGWNLYPDQKEAISRFMKGLVKAPPTFTLESLDRKVRKAAESAKNTWANMTPEEREARCAKMRHKHNVSEEGRKKLSELSKETIKRTIAAGKFKGSHKSHKSQETNFMMTTTNEVAAYIDQLKAKARLFASTFEKQPIENLVKIDAFLSAMLPGNTEVAANVETGYVELPHKRKYTRRSGAGLSKYKEPFQAYKSNGGKLKWHDWLKYAKTGVFPSPLDPVPQSQQATVINNLV